MFRLRLKFGILTIGLVWVAFILVFFTLALVVGSIFGLDIPEWAANAVPWLGGIATVAFFIYNETSEGKHKKNKQEEAEYECSECGATVDLNDDFCRGCGETLTR
jgi:hypothetical protein